MKNSKHSTIYYVLFAVLILITTIYILFVYKKEYLKIFVVYYKPAPIIKTEIFEPIQAGRSISTTPSRAGTFTQEEINWLKTNMIGDDTFDNISHLNRHFAEITALYWIYKNTSSPYVGMFQYRRYLSINPLSIYPYITYPSMRFRHLGINHLKGFSKDFLTNLELEKKIILPWFATHDILVAEPIKLNTYEQYKEAHYIKDLDIALNIIKQKYPHMYDFAVQNLNSDEGFYPSNLFITKREILNNYASWLFSIIFPVYEEIKDDLKNRPTEQQFAIAYLTERLFTIYLRYQQKHNGLLIKEFPFALASDFFLPPQNTQYLVLDFGSFEDSFIKHPKKTDIICGFNNPTYHCGKFEFQKNNRLKIKWHQKNTTYFTHIKDNIFKLEN